MSVLTPEEARLLIDHKESIIVRMELENDRIMEDLNLWKQSSVTAELELNELKAKLEQRIAMEIDEHLKVVSLQEKLVVAVNIIDTCHDAIKSLQVDALGTGEIDYNGEPYKYPIRDEVIDNINKALKRLEG